MFKMKTRIKTAITVLLTLALATCSHVAFLLLNMPSDFMVVCGAIIVLTIFVTGPTGYYLIWKKESVIEDEEPKDISA